jgi:hypothetical protein
VNQTFPLGAVVDSVYVRQLLVELVPVPFNGGEEERLRRLIRNTLTHELTNRRKEAKVCAGFLNQRFPHEFGGARDQCDIVRKDLPEEFGGRTGRVQRERMEDLPRVGSQRVERQRDRHIEARRPIRGIEARKTEEGAARPLPLLEIRW